MTFRDRQDAGDRLADRLEHYGGGDAIVLALPRGGVAVALPITRRIAAPLELLLVRKIGVPDFPEVAMGAIVDGRDPIVVRNEDVLREAGVSEAEFEAVAKRELAEIERRRSLYLRGREPLSPEGRTVIVVDDGIATGATLKAALKVLRRKNAAKIVVAVPVAPASLLDKIAHQVDELVCLETLGPVGAVGAHYLKFEQLNDDDVIGLLNAASGSGTPSR